MDKRNFILYTAVQETMSIFICLRIPNYGRHWPLFDNKDF